MERLKSGFKEVIMRVRKKSKSRIPGEQPLSGESVSTPGSSTEFYERIKRQTDVQNLLQRLSKNS